MQLVFHRNRSTSIAILRTITVPASLPTSANPSPAFRPRAFRHDWPRRLSRHFASQCSSDASIAARRLAAALPASSCLFAPQSAYPLAYAAKQKMSSGTTLRQMTIADATATPTATGTSNNLVHLGGDAFLLQGADMGSRSDDPDVIAIFGWMDGQPRHIRKYADKYRELYPSSKILILQSHSNYFWSSSAKREARVQSAIDFLEANGVTSKLKASRRHRLHIHAFSNGGSLQMIQVARVLQQRYNQRLGMKNPQGVTSAGHPFPASSIVVDSAPGGNALAPLLTAFTMPFKSRLARMLLYVPISFTWALLALRAILLRRPSPIDVLRMDMLDESLLPRDAPRLYIYSKADTIIRYKEVESHIAQAEGAGLQVEKTVYEKSAHVSHARADAEKYWSAIATLIHKISKRD